MRGDPAAWKTMVKYNKQDINLLYDVYMALRPWMNNHPNWNMYTEKNGCPTCGHKQVIRRGYRRTRTMTYIQYQCKGCGAFSRQRVAEKDYRPGIV